MFSVPHTVQAPGRGKAGRREHPLQHLLVRGISRCPLSPTLPGAEDTLTPAPAPGQPLVLQDGLAAPNGPAGQEVTAHRARDLVWNNRPWNGASEKGSQGPMTARPLGLGPWTAAAT